MAGIYLHIPFCKQACHYCDFHFSTSLKRKDELVQCLVKEISLRKDELNDATVETIYFGGGTPSLLTIEELNLLIETVYKNFKVVDSPEISLEANPDDLSTKQIHELADSRINRLSIGIQSFFDEDLLMMNRAHTSVEAKESLTEATRHFDNITIDLIYGIPNMTNDRWRENLQIAFDFGISHISSYALTIEPKTALATFILQGKYPNVSEETALEHFNTLVAETSKQGFVQYEISNFGKQDYFSKHNSSYWQGKPYLGIGPSAHSFDGKQRSWNVSNNIKYIKAIQQNEIPSEREILSDKDSFNEYIMTGLRTTWGVSLDSVQENFGLEFKNHLLKKSLKFIEENLLIISNESEKPQILRTTSKGKFLADGIASDLFLI